MAEFACAFPILLTLVVGLVVLGVGVSRYQIVALLARQAARWASVRGAEYAQSTGKAAATEADIYNNAILPRAIGMNPASVSCVVTWSPNNQPGSTVTVTVNYQWVPVDFVRPINLSSTSVMTMAY